MIQLLLFSLLILIAWILQNERRYPIFNLLRVVLGSITLVLMVLNASVIKFITLLNVFTTLLLALEDTFEADVVYVLEK